MTTTTLQRVRFRRALQPADETTSGWRSTAGELAAPLAPVFVVVLLFLLFVVVVAVILITTTTTTTTADDYDDHNIIHKTTSEQA